MDVQDGALQFTSDAPPAHYMVKVQSFSHLTKNSIEKYESGEFEAGGYKWKLILYPSGNKSKNVKDFVSLYLALVEGTNSLHPGWEIYATFRFFLLDQNNGNYLVVQDDLNKERRFQKMKEEMGFDEFISVKAFSDGSKGYLVDDTCVFGAEVFVCRERSAGKGESLVMTKDVFAYKHVWGIDNFSNMNEDYYDSKPFNAGNHKWKIRLYPNGKDAGLGSYLSLFVALADPTTLPSSTKIYTEITLRILEQKQAKHYYGKANYWFKASSCEQGWTRFILLSVFNSQYLGYLVRGSCLVEAEVTVLGVVNELS